MTGSPPPPPQHEDEATDWETTALNLSGQLDRLLLQHLQSTDRHGQLALVGVAERIYKFRRLRDRVLEGSGGPELFREPAWDMLLDLYIARARNRQISVSSLCRAACVPDTTGLRWIALLGQYGLVIRLADPVDGRRTFVDLTPKALDLMSTVLTAASRR